MRIGLTGGVASGKSTVSAIFRELGALVIDADVLAREVVAPGTPGLEQVVRVLGPHVLTGSGELDRPKVAGIVFTDEEARRRLESVVHPLVRERAAQSEAEAAPGTVVVHDIPLLAETNQAGRFDAVVVVDVPEEMQVDRMVSLRGITLEDAEARVRAQASREQRHAIASYLIENTGSLEELRERVDEVYRQLMDLFSSGAQGPDRGARPQRSE